MSFRWNAAVVKRCVARVSAAALLVGMVPAAADAAIVFETDAPTYVAGPTGVPQASVRVFLTQTAGTTTISSNGGLNAYGFRVSPAAGSPANAPQLVSVVSNPQFNDDDQVNLAAGTVLDNFQSLTGGSSPEPTNPNRYFLATLNFSGQSAATTTFTVSRRTGTSSDNITPNEVVLDQNIQSGQFTITVVPEPATSAAIVGLAGLGLAARRRRRCPA